MSGLHLSRLSLSHFRSHKRAVVECDERPVAIFGANGAGKTNLIEAVSLLSPGRGLRRASAEAMTRRPEALGWKVKGELSASGQSYEVETWSKDHAARQVKIDGKAATQIALGQIARVLWLIPAMDRLWIEGADGRRRFLDRMAMSFHPTHAEATLSYEKAMRERNRLLKDTVQDPHWYRALELQMADSGMAIMRNRRDAVMKLTAAQEAAQTSFPTATLSLLEVESAPIGGDDDLLQALQDSRAQDLRAGRTLVGPHRSDLDAVYAAKDVPARDCSTGEQKALLISLILANARALIADIGAPPLLLLDEVAAHLDAGRRAALYDEITALGAQAWMTGTEPHLFDALGERATYLEVDADTVREATG